MKKLFALALVGLGGWALAESITLKNGEVINGDVKKATKDGASVEVSGVRVDVPWDFLDPAKACELWESKLAWDDVKSLSDLAAYCDTKGMSTDSKRIWEKVVKAAPDNEDARAALGYVKEGGEWILASAKKAVDPPVVPGGGGSAPLNNLAVPANIPKEAVAHDKKGDSIIDEAKKNPKGVVEQSELGCVEYRKAIKGCKDFALAWYHLGIAYQFTKDYREAVDALLSAIKINPNFYEAYVELGDAYAWLRDEDKAVLNYKKALEINANYAHGWSNMAMVEMKRRRFAEARAACDKALALDSNDGLAKMISPMIDGEIAGPKFSAPEIRKKSKHFEVITDGGQKVADTMSEHLEHIYAVYEKVFPKIQKDDLLFPVVVYKDNAEYMAAGSPPNTGGFFNPLLKKLVFFWMGDAKLQDTLMVLYHETFHSFLDYYLEDATQWFNEGHGDYFGAWKWDEAGQRMVCRTNWWRLDGLKKAIQDDRITPVKELLQMTQAEMYGKNIGVNYAEAWSIVYFMWTFSGGKYAGVIRNYFFEMQKGSGIKRCYDNTFGKLDMRLFEDEWKRYTLGLENPAGVTMPGPGPGGPRKK